MVIKPLMLSALESALNQYLAMDADAGFFLAPLAGKVIAVTILPFNESIYLCPATDSIQVLDEFPGQPDTRLTGSVLALGLMGLGSKPQPSNFFGEVEIAGDMATGRQFQELFGKLDIDLEEKLSYYTGDIIAHQIGRFFRAGQSWGKDSIETFRLNAAEFLQEETRDLPAGPEIDIFYARVEELRNDFERLQSRVERLEKLL